MASKLYTNADLDKNRMRVDRVGGMPPTLSPAEQRAMDELVAMQRGPSIEDRLSSARDTLSRTPQIPSQKASDLGWARGFDDRNRRAIDDIAAHPMPKNPLDEHPYLAGGAMMAAPFIGGPIGIAADALSGIDAARGVYENPKSPMSWIQAAFSALAAKTHMPVSSAERHAANVVDELAAGKAARGAAPKAAPRSSGTGNPLGEYDPSLFREADVTGAHIPNTPGSPNPFAHVGKPPADSEFRPGMFRAPDEVDQYLPNTMGRSHIPSPEQVPSEYDPSLFDKPASRDVTQTGTGVPNTPSPEGSLQWGRWQPAEPSGTGIASQKVKVAPKVAKKATPRPAPEILRGRSQFDPQNYPARASHEPQAVEEAVSVPEGPPSPVLDSPDAVLESLRHAGNRGNALPAAFTTRFNKNPLGDKTRILGAGKSPLELFQEKYPTFTELSDAPAPKGGDFWAKALRQMARLHDFNKGMTK